MKKLLCLLVTLLLLLAGHALAEDESVWQFDTYSYSLEGYTGSESELVVPELIQDCTVDILGLNAFNSAAGITSITLPSTLRQIENGALAFCDDLSSVILNDGLLIIGDNFLISAPKLEEIIIPSSVCYIGSNAFSNCESLKHIVFQGECPVFADIAFDWLPSDAVIYVPENQYDAYAAAFAGMDLYPDLQSSGADAEAPVPSVVAEQFAFDAETGTITYYEGYDVRVDVPAEIDGVPVRAIADSAFADRNYMCYLNLPDSIESIGASAFEGCVRLLHVDFPASLKSIGSRAFAAGLQAWRIDLPEGLEAIGDEAFEYAAKLSGTLTLPEGLKHIGSRAFANTYWLEEVYFPATVETIGENAFLDSSLNYVVFEGLELPEFPDSAFAGCTYLADVDLHTKTSKQQMLDLQARLDAAGLTCRVWRMQNPEVDYFSDGLDVYENGVLVAYTGSETHVRPYDTFDDVTVTALGDGVFQGNTTIEYFSVPYNDCFTTIGAEAFANSSLARIDLFDSVTTINGGAFRNCANLTELVLPESVSFVGVESLNGCTNLRKLVVLCDPTVLPADLLAECPADMEIYAGPNATDEQLDYLTAISGRPFYTPVTRVGEALPVLTAMPYEPLDGEEFWYDTEFARLDSYEGYELNLVLPREAGGVAMQMIGGGMMGRAYYGDNYEQELPVVSVVIPETYTEIPAYAFENCDTLETVICYAPIENLEDYTFLNCTSLREVVFVNGVHNIGQYVFANCPSLETVYLGGYTDSISDTAFLDEFGEPVWSIDSCITDPALLPDVDAMLAAVEREPMAEPEPTPAPVAVPVGAEGEPFFGLWHGTEMNLGGEVYALSDFDMVMSLMLCEDGRMVLGECETIDMSLVGDGDWYAWHVEDGVAYGDIYTMTIEEDGSLILNDSDFPMTFVRSADSASVPAAQGEAAPETAPEAAPEAAPETAPETAPEAAPEASGAAVQVGVRYVCVSGEVDGYTLEAAMLGGEYAITLHEDGSAELVIVGSAIPGMMWTATDAGGFAIDYFGTALEGVPTEAGFDMNYFDTMLLHFVPEE